MKKAVVKSGNDYIVFKKGKFPYKYTAKVYFNGKLEKHKTVHFGHQDYQQYKDSVPLGLYKKFDHNDEERRDRYYKRHNKDYPKYSKDWFSKKFLW